MTQPLSDLKCLQDYLAKLDKYYHRRNYGQTHYTRIRKKSLKKKLNKIGPTIEPCGTLDVIV